MIIIKKIIYSVLFISILFLSGYALSTVAPFSNYKTYFLFASLFCVAVLFVFTRRINTPKASIPLIKNHSSLIVFLVFLIVCTVSTIVNFSYLNLNSFIFVSLILIVSFLFTIIIPFQKFLRFFINTLLFISIVAIVGFVITEVFRYEPNFGLVTNINGTIYQNGFIWFRIKYSNFSNRAMGVFWEPGLLATFSTIALIASVLTKQKHLLPKSIIFIISIIVSQSTAGLILLLLSLIIIALQTSGYKKIISGFVLILLLFFVIVFSNEIRAYLTGLNLPLLRKLDLGVDTTSVRIQSINLNFEIFKTSPLFGVGLGDSNILFAEMAQGQIAQTSTSTYFMAALGFFGITYTLLLAWLSLKIGMAKGSFLTGVFVFFVFLFIVNKEPHSSFLIDFIFIFYLSNPLNNQYKFYGLRQKNFSHNQI